MDTSRIVDSEKKKLVGHEIDSCHLVETQLRKLLTFCVIPAVKLRPG